MARREDVRSTGRRDVLVAQSTTLGQRVEEKGTDYIHILAALAQTLCIKGRRPHLADPPAVHLGHPYLSNLLERSMPKTPVFISKATYI